MEEDFCLIEGNVLTEFIDRVSSLKFSGRVQDFIQFKMARSVVVKLLGVELVSTPS